jgi:hypothetical protein
LSKREGALQQQIKSLREKLRDTEEAKTDYKDQAEAAEVKASIVL